MRLRWSVPVLAAVVALVAATGPAPAARADTPTEWVGAGPVRLVYNPGATEQPARYLNDHTVIKAPDGTWHMFGITATRVADGVFPDGGREVNFAHATAPSLAGPWTTQPYALTVNPNYFGEAHLWAPHVIANGGTYYMYYAAGGNGAAINLATSTDLYHWTRIASGPLFRGVAARDPYVVRIGSQWVMYYCEVASDHHHIVAYRTSTDLVHWGAPGIAFTDPSLDTNSASDTESPFVVSHNGSWYLFTGPRGGYTGTDVFRSTDPLRFALGNYAGHVPVHAAEVVNDGSQWWVTGAGSFSHGLYLTDLHWQATPPIWQNPASLSSVADAQGRVQLFALGTDSTVLRSVETARGSGAFGAWQSFGSTAGAVPSVAVDQAGRLELFAPNATGTSLLRRAQTDAASDTWGPWSDFGTAAGASPATGRFADGRLAVFVLTPAGAAINYRVEDGAGGWTAWQQFGTAAGAPPVVGTNADGRLEVFAVGPGGAYLAHRWQNSPNGTWSNWDGAFGGPGANVTPSVGADADGRMELFLPHPVGITTGQRVQSTPSGGWFNWLNFGNTWLDAAPAVRRDADGKLHAFYPSPGGGDLLVHKQQTAPNGSWSAEAAFDDGFPGGQVPCTPAVATESDGRLLVLALTPDGKLQRRTQTAAHGGTWTSWAALGSTTLAVPSCGGAT